MNAIEFLIKEHNKVRGMLADIADGSHHFETKRKRFEALSQDLIRHEMMEHEVWYPHFKKDLPDTLRHLLKEEKIAENEIKKIDGLKTEGTWDEHFMKFKRGVEHHASEEEHDLFPEVEKLLSEKELLQIGADMLEYKRKYSA